MRKWLIDIFVMAFIALVAASCSGDGKQNQFVLDGELVNGKVAKTVYLYKYLSEYNKIELLDSAVIKSGSFHMSGSCEEPSEAFVRLDKEHDVYGFVLENATLRMKIGQNSYAVTGTDDNDRLSMLVMLQHRAVNNRKHIQDAYSKLVADSSLTKSAEDSLLDLYRSQSACLRDSVYKAINERIDARPEFARVAFRTLSFTLSPLQADSLSVRLGFARK